MSVEEAFVETLRLIDKLEQKVNDLETRIMRSGMATKKGRAATLSSDAFEAVHHYYYLQPQSGTTDDLSTINGGREGRLLAIRTEDIGDTITVKDGVGNINLDGSDVTLDSPEKVLVLLYDNTLVAWIRYGL